MSSNLTASARLQVFMQFPRDSLKISSMIPVACRLLREPLLALCISMKTRDSLARIRALR